MTPLRVRTLMTCAVASLLLAVGFAACAGGHQPAPGTVLDEAKAAGVGPEKLAAAADEYLHDMDGGISLTINEIKGRNTWVMWTGGNDRFWDLISATSFGALDLLKTISSYSYEPRQNYPYQYDRGSRWKYLGLVNEPCFEKPTGPDPARFGLWLDKRRTGPDCPPDPFESETNYPGVRAGSRGKDLKLPNDPRYAGWPRTMPVGSYYGYPTGIVGLRLFPNPAFDEKAARNWDPVKYYTDPNYYLTNIVKPYRIGMSCGFCHVGPNPLKPPTDPENPKWENISSNVGAQYFWVDRIFDWDSTDWDYGQPNAKTSFFFQLFHVARPGALDTSLVSTDNIVNPRTMNAVYQLGPRLGIAKEWHRDMLQAGESDQNKQFGDYPQTAAFSDFYQKPYVSTPRVLKDGSDSVGALGALNRVYLNIGLFSEEWLLHFQPLFGGKETTAIRIVDNRRNSSYWNATEAQTADMALFFLKSTGPHLLQDAPNVPEAEKPKPADVARGKDVFAERCARCHSSKHPPLPAGLDFTKCDGQNGNPDYLSCFKTYWQWTRGDEFKAKMRDVVRDSNFLKDNFLSTDLRIPVSLLQTNICSPLATNAIRNNIWDNFSSETYKSLPAVDAVTLHDPWTGKPYTYPESGKLPAGGRGYTRPASLVSVWSTAPYLLNNTVGKFDPNAPSEGAGRQHYTPSPSVEVRLAAFEDGIRKMLWPEKREKDPIFKTDEPGVGFIDRTTTRSFINIPVGFIPDGFRGLLDFTVRLFPFVYSEKDRRVTIGPIPKGTPVGLIASLDMLGDATDNEADRAKRRARVLALVIKAKHDLRELGSNPTDEQAQAKFQNLAPEFMALSKCPDFVANKGHYFGTEYFNRPPFPENVREPGLSDADKEALIAFLKTF
jgi:hypothetical protein